MVKAHDLVWLVVFGGLVYCLRLLPFPLVPGDLPELLPLIALAIAQILEPRLPQQPTTRSRIFWISLKLILGFVVIGYTGGIYSSYWPVLFLPVLSAATSFGGRGTLIVTLLAGGTYLTFLKNLLNKLHEDDQQLVDILDIVMPFVSLAMIGNLAHILAGELRIRSEKHRRTAEQLAEANVQIRQAQEAVRRSDRLAALGQLSAGLAHELRNPLGTIKASSEMLSRTVAAENEVAKEMAEFIHSEVDRCNSLITRFLQFARPLQLQMDTADLSQTLDRAIALVERETPKIAIYKNYEIELPPFPFDAELLERVFYNLVLNAAQATSTPGGAVTVKTRAIDGMAEVCVIDRGVGIDPQHLDSIFNPFFTTKPEGVGLGLAIVAKIVDEHGGKIAVESEPGKGSIFHVLLPMHPPSRERQVAEKTTAGTGSVTA